MIGDAAIRNGELIPASEAMLPVTSREVQCNFSVYESLRVIEGRAVHLPEHLARLRESAGMLGLVHPFADGQIESWIYLLIKHQRIERASMRVLIVGGAEPVLFITASPILEYPRSMYDDGVFCTVYSGERFMPECKTSNLLLNYLALEDSKRRGGFEALLLDRDGCLREGTRSNFYGFRNGVLYTAPLELVLDGVTRRSVLRAARESGIQVREEAVRYVELGEFDEVFISATSMSAMPVSRIENLVFNSGHKRTLKLSEIVRDRELDEKA